jgi:hypothetical protein
VENVLIIVITSDRGLAADIMRIFPNWQNLPSKKFMPPVEKGKVSFGVLEKKAQSFSSAVDLILTLTSRYFTPDNVPAIFRK